MSEWTWDICGSTDNVLAGNWIFYCKEHKDVDRQKTLDNELHNNYDNLDELDYESLEILI